MSKKIKINELHWSGGIIVALLLMPTIALAFLCVLTAIPAVIMTVLLSFVGLADVDFVEKTEENQEGEGL